MGEQPFSTAVYYRDPRSASAWLERAFGFQVTMLVEGPDQDPRTMHVELALGGRGTLMVGGEWSGTARSPASVGGANTQSVHVTLPSGLDAHCEHARAAGATIAAEPEDQFHGDRTYRAVDPEGHVWTFSMHVRDVSTREMEQATGFRIQSSTGN